MTMLFAILSGFAGSFAAPLIHRLGKRISGWVLALLPSALGVYFLGFLPVTASGRTVSVAYPWAPQLNVQLSFYLDGLALLFALVIVWIGALVVLYGSGYLAGHPQLDRFYAYTLLFMASMLGLVLADNILLVFVFWELTSISSFLLIGFYYRRAESRAAAQQAFLVTGGGGLAMLGGLVWFGLEAGSFELSELVRQGAALQGEPFFLPAMVLILVGAFAKSAQFPFHFWLPNAMEAPAPVSAYLHSATMVKAGVYMIARLHPVFSNEAAWLWIVGGVGTVTMLIGAYMALNTTDLKRILAYSTISSLGTMVTLLALRGDGPVSAALVYLLAHALYKGALFMVAGAIDHETGTRSVERLGGLRSAMPVTAAIAVLAAISLAGLGPVLSFIGKELLFEAVLHVEENWFIFVPAAVLASAVSVAVALIVSLRPFFGAQRSTPKHPHDPPVSMWVGPALLSVLGLVFGLAPGWVARMVVSPAVTAVLQEPQPVALGLWHGFNLALLLSGVAIGLGALFYWVWGVWRQFTTRFERIMRYGPEGLYEATFRGINGLAVFQTRLLQSGHLRNYLLIILLTSLALIGLVLVSSRAIQWPERYTDILFHEAALAGVIIIAAVAAVRSRTRLAAVASLGVVGYGVALIFLLFGAPDLAMTQFLVESLTVILFVFAFYHLPQFAQLSRSGSKAVHLVVAILTGSMMTSLVLAVSGINFFPKISEFFTENAVPLAHGRNIVNVILVDFRGIDTLGEITVLAVAATGVFALLRLRKEDGR